MLSFTRGLQFTFVYLLWFTVYVWMMCSFITICFNLYCYVLGESHTQRCLVQFVSYPNLTIMFRFFQSLRFAFCFIHTHKLAVTCWCYQLCLVKQKWSLDIELSIYWCGITHTHTHTNANSRCKIFQLYEYLWLWNSHRYLSLQIWIASESVSC